MQIHNQPRPSAAAHKAHALKSPGQDQTQAPQARPEPRDTVEISHPHEPEPEGAHPLVAGLHANYTIRTGEKDAPNDEPPAPDPDRTKSIGVSEEQKQAEERERQLEEARKNGEQTTITNGQGQQVNVQVALTEGDGNHDAYNLTIGERQVRVEIPKGEDPDSYLSRVSDFYSQEPENLQGSTNLVTFESGRDPEGKAAAEASNGQITFYSGDQFLDKHTFDHEFAHNVADIVEDRQAGFGERFRETVNGHEVDDGWNAYIPNGYNDAIDQDKRSVTPYGDTNGAEDFAEAYADYQEAQAKGPQALEQFQQQYPNRTRVIEEIIANQPDLTPSTR